MRCAAHRKLFLHEIDRSLGPTSATSTGLMLFGAIPINQNTRFENAMAEAAQRAGVHALPM